MHDCTQKEIINELVEHKGRAESDNITLFKMIEDIRDNHLYHLAKEVKAIGLKMSSRRPSWAVCKIITLLTSLVSVLLTVILMKVVAR